jgi:uncharacterized protein (DUF433 family)
MTDMNIIAAFDEEYASKLSGVSKSQLSYWARSGFFQPAHAREGFASFARIYSFKDIVALKVLNTLRNQFHVSLQHLRDVSEKLSHLADNKWTGVKLYVVNRRVVWIDPGTERPQEIASGQFVVPVVLDEVVNHTKKDLAKLKGRDEATVGRIGRGRHVNHNAPVIAGTRVPVSAVRAFADAGYSVEGILAEYPDLTKADVQAALSYKSSKAA